MIRRGNFEGFSVDMVDLGVNILAISAVSCIFISWLASLSILLCHHTPSDRRKTLRDVYQELRAPFQYGRPNIHIFHHFTLEAFRCLNADMSQPLWLGERVSDIYKSLAYHCERQASYLFDKSRRRSPWSLHWVHEQTRQTVNQQEGCFSVLHGLHTSLKDPSTRPHRAF